MARLHIFGGTSDARKLCTLLDQIGMDYSVSVASDVGRAVAAELQGDIHVGRLDANAMIDWLKTNAIQCVVDAAHPYATLLHRNIQTACESLGIQLIRYERPSEVVVEHPLIHRVPTVAAACDCAQTLGPRVLLTTGSKDLLLFRQALPNHHLIARVLPTAEVIQQCESLGFGVDQIIGMKGPFTAEMNQALYQFCQPDVVITKESGQEGGFQEKIQPCIVAGIHCIVIERPQSVMTAQNATICHTIEEILPLLTCFQTREPA